MFEISIGVLRWIHILAGFAAFFVAPVALATQKGGPAHRRWGKVYFWGMTVGTLTALVVAAYRPNIFLLLIAVFSFYLSFSGYRVLSRKRPDQGQKASALDWAVALITLSVSIFMIVRGTSNSSTANIRLNPILIVFGIVGVSVAGNDLYKFFRPPRERYAWFLGHMSGMLASYIAAVSAFSAVNFSFLPPLVRWLWPSAIGAPLVGIWIRYHKRKFTQGAQATEVSMVQNHQLVEEMA